MNLCRTCSIWQNSASDPETSKTAYCMVAQGRKHRLAKACEHHRGAAK